MMREYGCQISSMRGCGPPLDDLSDRGFVIVHVRTSL
jgi:hypothetical protein